MARLKHQQQQKRVKEGSFFFRIRLQLSRCLSLRTYCTLDQRMRNASTSWSAWCSTPTPTSWTWNAPGVTRSQQFSVTLRQSSFALVAPQFCVNPQEEGQGWQKAALSERSNIKQSQSFTLPPSNIERQHQLFTWAKSSKTSLTLVKMTSLQL